MDQITNVHNTCPSDSNVEMANSVRNHRKWRWWTWPRPFDHGSSTYLLSLNVIYIPTKSHNIPIHFFQVQDRYILTHVRYCARYFFMIDTDSFKYVAITDFFHRFRWRNTHRQGQKSISGCRPFTWSTVGMSWWPGLRTLYSRRTRSGWFSYPDISILKSFGAQNGLHAIRNLAYRHGHDTISVHAATIW